MKKMILPQRTGVAAIALLAAFAVVAPAVTASAAESGANTESSTAVLPRPKYTVASYTKYLEKRAKKDASARAVLKHFKKLSSAKKKKFVYYIQDTKTQKAFVGNASKKGKKKFSTVAAYNKDVTFLTKAATDVEPHSIRDVTWNEKATFDHRQKIFGIEVMKLSLWVNYKASRGDVAKTVNAGAGVKNFNAAVSIDNKQPQHWVSRKKAGYEGKARVEVVWEGNIAYKGSSVRLDKRQSMTAYWDGGWKGSLKNI